MNMFAKEGCNMFLTMTVRSVCALFLSLPLWHSAVADDYEVGKEPKYERYYEDVLVSKKIATGPQGLASGLRDQDPRIRAYSAILIRQKDFRQLQNALSQAFTAESQENPKLRMAEALMTFGNDLPLDYLRSVVRRGEINSSSILAAGLLSRRGDASGYPIVKKAVSSSGQVTRTEAVLQLGDFVRFEGSKVQDVRVSVYDDFDAILAKDESGFVRSEAARELSDLGTPEALRVLQSHAKSGDEKLRQVIDANIRKMQTRTK